MEASYIDLADPAHLEFGYLRWMRIILLACRARRNLHIGGGACALPRALAASDPAGLQVVCESQADVLALARQHLGLRRAPGLRVRHAEGREFLAGQPSASFDAVVIDAFVGAAVPPQLITREALSDAARVAPLLLINVVDSRTARVVRSVETTLGSAYPQVWRVAGRGLNSVLAAGRLTPSTLDRVAARLAADPLPASLDRARL